MIRSRPYQFSTLSGSIRWYDSVGSTNDALKAVAENGGDEGTVVVADVQTAGRGRQGRAWISERGGGLCLSVLLRPQTPLRMLGHLTLVSAISVAEAAAHYLETVGIDPAARIDIKWPNDVLADGKKLAGILVETGLIGERAKWAVVGIGVNLARGFFPRQLEGLAIALDEVTSATVSRDDFAMEFLRRFDAWYSKMAGGQMGEIRERWCELSSFASGRVIEIETGEGTLRGTTRGLDRDGALLLHLSTGEDRAIFVGDVLRVLPSASDRTERGE